MTEATPRHNGRIPSVVEIERKCWVMVFRGGGRGKVVALGEVDAARRADGESDGRTCIRV